MKAARVWAAVAILSCATGRAAISERDVTFAHGDATLAATLLAPAGGGPHPGVIFMPGSGAQTREPLLGIARQLAEQGMVALVYDKQGSGKSGGSWIREGLDDLAGDARAAIGFLENQPEVDAHAIGAWGISQSGWVVPRLARQYPLRFAIVVTGGAVTPREVERFGYEARLRHAGVGDAERRLSAALVERYLNYLANGDDRSGLLAALRDSESQAWGKALGIARVLPDEADRAKWSWVGTYDPAPDIRALQMPVLVLLGARDPFVPAGEAMARWADALAATGNRADQVNVYPAAGHGIRTNGHDMQTPPVYAPGYLSDQTRWLESIGVLAKSRPSGR